MNENTPASGEARSSGAEVRPASGPDDGPGRPSGRSGALVMVARLGLLGVAILGFVAAVQLTRARDRDDRRAEEMPTERYACPMHPEILSPVPGECPICRMALERVSGVEKHSPTAARDGVVGVVQERVVSQMVRAPAWRSAEGELVAVLYKDDLVGMDTDERARFFSTTTPGTAISVRRSAGPTTPWDTETVGVTFRFEPHGPAAVDGGWLEIAPHPRRLLVVPTSAILYSGAGAYVLVAPPDGRTFVRRTVEVGRILDSGYGAGLVDDRYGAIVVRSGLKAGERIIIEDTFFMDAERRLQAAQGNRAEVTL